MRLNRVLAVGMLVVVSGLTAPRSTPAFAQTVNQTFSYTGGEQTFTVPANASVLTITTVSGAGGMSGTNIADSAGGGARAKVVASFPVGADQLVKPNQTLYVEVGGDGSFGTAGFNGGGKGAGGGGGASDVQTVSGPAGLSGGVPAPGAWTANPAGDLLILAGGGGGGGGQGGGGVFGGIGGSAGNVPGNGSAGTAAGSPSGGGATGGGGGGGGSSSAGGPGGAAGTFTCTGGAGGAAGHGGSLGLGATGPTNGGGGGGGYYGGGGGGTGGSCPGGPFTAASGGGGAGSNYVNAAGTTSSIATDRSDSAPSIVISYVVFPTVTVTTTPASPPVDGYFNAANLPTVNVSATDPSGITNLICTDAVNAGTTGAVTVGKQSNTNATTRTGSFSLSADGTHAITCTATDGDGNTGAATGSSNTATIKIDATAPTSSMQCNGSACSSSAYSAAVSVSISANDGGSGVSDIKYTTDGSDPTTGSPTTVAGATASFTVSSTETVKWIVQDNAGNSEAVQSQTITIQVVAASSLSVASASGTYGGTSDLSATLTSIGNPVSGQSISFSLNGAAVCGGSGQPVCPTTTSAGTATLSDVSLAGINAGTYTGAVSASFAGGGGYPSGSGANDLTVGPAALSITANNQSYTYGGTFSLANAVTYGAFQGSDSSASLTGTPSCGVYATSDTSYASALTPGGTSLTAGTYTIHCGGQHDSNYTITWSDGTLTVGKQATSFSGVSGSGTYAGTATLVATLLDASGNGLAGKTIVFSIGGAPVCGGSNQPSCPTTADGGNGTVQGQATLAGADLTGIDAGTDHNGVSASLSNDPNYAGSSGTGDLIVAQASATLSLSNLTQTYSGSPDDVTVTTSPPDLTGVSVTYTGATYPASTTAPTNVGSYSVDAALSNANYTASDVTGTLTINPADQTIIVGTPAPPSAAYNGQFTVAATAPGGDVTYGSSGACTNNGATYTMTTGTGACTVTFDQAGNGNYNPAPRVTETVNATQVSLTITADDQTVQYSDQLPALTVQYSGFVANDGPSSLQDQLSCSTAATVTSSGQVLSPVGTYTITCSGLSSANYAISYVAGTLTISPADQTITFASLANKTYGDPPFAVSATASSGLPVSFAASGSCTVAGSTVTITGAGSCTLTASQAGDGNHNAAPGVPQTFSIAKAPLTITASSASMTYGGTLPSITPGYIGLVNGDSAPATAPTCSTSATAGSPVGSYPTSCAGAADPNYAISYVAGTLTITKAATTTSLISSANPSISKQSVTFTATVAAVAPGAGTPSGSVTFKDGATTLGTGTLSGGTATLTTAALAPGTHSITASYGGDAGFKASSGTAVSQQVRYNVKVLSTTGLSIVLQLVDANKANVSASALRVTAECVVPYTAVAPTTCGAAPVQAINKAFGFVRNYKGLGSAYSYSVNAHGLTKGQSYYLLAQTDGDPIWHAVQFTD